MRLQGAHRAFRRLAAAAATALMVACGSGGGGGSTSATSASPPVISLHPASYTVVTDVDATFSVAVSGAGPFTYQWQRNGADIPGANAATYTLSGAQLGDSGSTWRVVVSNAAGSITSQAATLVVKSPPTVVTLSGALGGGGKADGRPGQFAYPCGVAADASGTLFVADTQNATVRKVAPDGTVTTFAGRAGLPGHADGQGNAARFQAPMALAVHASGTVYVADAIDHTIRTISASGQVATLAGKAGNYESADGKGTDAQFYEPSGVAVDSAGTVYVADARNHTIRKISPSGWVSTLAGLAGSAGAQDGAGAGARFNFPRGLALEASGALLVADSQNSRIRRVDAQGNVTTVATLPNPNDVATDPAGNIYVATPATHAVRRIAAGASTSTVLAGTVDNAAHADGTGAAARFNLPSCLGRLPSGNLVVADTRNHLLRTVTPAGAVSTFAGTASDYGAADGALVAARYSGPAGLALDGAGNLWVAGGLNATIRRLSATAVSTVAGLAGQVGSTDGSGSAARFRQPGGAVADSTGNVYVTDIGNNTIRRVTPAGDVTTLAGNPSIWGHKDGTGIDAEFRVPAGLALDAQGNLVLADMYNHTIRRITPAGVVTTLAGQAGSYGTVDGRGNAARFRHPAAVAVASDGAIWVADGGNHLIRRITAAGEVSTVAGSPGEPGSTDGAGAQARFHSPGAIHITAQGQVYVLDTGNSTLRKVSDTGVVTTVARLPAIAGLIVTTVPDGLLSPGGLASAPDGTVYVSVQHAVLSFKPE